MIRRLILAGSVSAAALGGLFMAAPAAHAAGQVCVQVQAGVAGTSVVDQSQCQAVPDLPAPPALP